MKWRPFKSFLGKPLNLPTGKAWYEEDILNAERGFVKQFGPSHPEQGEQGEVYKWVKAKDRTPNHGDCFRIQWVNPYEPSHKEWIYFNGSVNEYDQVYDIDNEVGEINQDTVEWLCKLSSPPPEGQDELWKQLQKILMIAAVVSL